VKRSSLLAALMALNAIAIDSMIPALEDIASHLGVSRKPPPAGADRLHDGLRRGQLFWGPLADRFGRKPT
jgi:DHA1 family bicyclomycin/chloramphenicol resistance-like MFS transporter